MLAGVTGQVSPAIEHGPNAPATFQWVVERLAGTGAPDASFGGDGIGRGLRLQQRADGGHRAHTPQLALDPAFGGPRQPAMLRVTVPAQRARTAAKVRTVAVSLRSSGPGLGAPAAPGGAAILCDATPYRRNGGMSMSSSEISSDER